MRCVLVCCGIPPQMGHAMLPKVFQTITLMLVLTACGADGPANNTPPAAGTDAVVELTTTLKFAPERLTIPAGATVEWRNSSILDHTVSGDPATAEYPADVAIPAGAAGFSADLPAGGVFRHTFNVPGTYRYYCDPHHGLGMKGEITVTP